MRNSNFVSLISKDMVYVLVILQNWLKLSLEVWSVLVIVLCELANDVDILYCLIFGLGTMAHACNPSYLRG